MTREEKNLAIEDLAKQLNNSSHIYLTDTSELNAGDTSDLRRECFKQNIRLLVVKNTLLFKALEKSDKNSDELKAVLKNPTAIMFTEVANAPAKLIKEFRKAHEKPLVKAAYVEESVYVGDDQLENLTKIKSKFELIGDLVYQLQSPAHKVISQLQSGKHLLAGITKTLSERSE